MTRKVQDNKEKCFLEDYNNQSMGHKSHEHLQLLPGDKPLFSVRVHLFLDLFLSFFY